MHFKINIKVSINKINSCIISIFTFQILKMSNIKFILVNKNGSEEKVYIEPIWGALIRNGSGNNSTK